ncbi:MAG: tetratricopeptide repeat protein [Terricaulis sp.]
MKRVALLALCVAAAACGPNGQSASSTDEDWFLCDIVHGDAAAKEEACNAVIADPGRLPGERAAAHVNRGALRALDMQDARALADFGRALRIGGADAKALLARGALHLDRGAFDEALEDFNAALAIAPESEALRERGRALLARDDDYYDRLDRADEMLSLDPDNPSVLNERCWLRAVSGEDLDQALEDCDRSLRQRPDDANTLDSRALVHLKRGEFAAALTDYDAALARSPGRGRYAYGRGLAQFGLGRVAEARANLEAGEAAAPNTSRTFARYGVAAP